MRHQPDILDQFVREALQLGVDTLEVEYRNGREEIVAYVGSVGRELAALGSGTAQAKALRSALYESTERPHRLSVGNQDYLIRAKLYDTFGEDAFRIKLRRSNNQFQRTRTAMAGWHGPRR